WRNLFTDTRPTPHRAYLHHRWLRFALVLMLLGPARASSARVHEDWRGSGHLVPFRENGLTGYLDVRTGETRIPPQFDSADVFSDGLAAVLIAGRWGYIDESGN